MRLSRILRELPPWLLFVLAAATLLSPVANSGQGERVFFLSTQLRPISEAQKMRNVILKGFSRDVDFATESPRVFLSQLKAKIESGRSNADVIGALHTELQPLLALDALLPLDDLVSNSAARAISGELITLGKFGTPHQFYIPWMQAGYIMVANKQALRYLPAEADIDRLTYDQLAAWADNLHENTGKRLLGFPAGSQGLMHRFFEGFLYPSFTGGVVRPFRSAEAEAMWIQFAALWKSVNPNAANYSFMAQPLLSGEVWIAFDHVARLLDALRQKPDDFVALPAPSGSKGRGYMPVLAGLSVLRTTRNIDGARALIGHLTSPATQIETARSVGFFPVAETQLPADLEPSLQMSGVAIRKTQSAVDAIRALPPIGLGARGDEFDQIFLDTFQFIAQRGQNARAVLDREAETLQRLLVETGAPGWEPDPPSPGPCRVQ